MSLGYSKYLRVIYSIGDFLLLNAAFCGVSYYFKWPDLTADSNFLAQFLYINLFWVITTFFTKIHKIDRGLRYEQILVQLKWQNILSVSWNKKICIFGEWISFKTSYKMTFKLLMSWLLFSICCLNNNWCTYYKSFLYSSLTMEEDQL